MKQFVRFLLIILLFTFGAFAQNSSSQVPEESGPEREVMSAKQAMREIFGNTITIVSDTIAIPFEIRDSLSTQLHHAVKDSMLLTWKVYSKSSQHLRGFAVQTEELGKYRPITILIAADTDFTVAGVRILIYRESRGGEVARKRFLHQYQGKSLQNPIRINRDIISISGATISVRGVNAGVRKSLTLLRWYYGD